MRRRRSVAEVELGRRPFPFSPLPQRERPMFRCNHYLVSLSVVLVTSALVVGCSEDEQATPRVTFESGISSGKRPPAECGKAEDPWFQIGSFGNPAQGKVDPLDPES